MRYVATIQTFEAHYASRITDLAIAEIGGRQILLSATYLGGGLASFDIPGADLPAVQRGQWDYPAIYQHQGDPQIVLLRQNGQVSVSLVGLSSGATQIRTLGADGLLGGALPLYGADRLPGDVNLLGEVRIGAHDYIYAARRGQVEYTIYREDAGGGLTQTARSIMPMASLMPHASLDRMISVQQGAETVLVALSGQGNFLTSQRLDAQGRIIRADYLKLGDGTGFNVPNDVAAVTVGNQVYLIMTSARSSSITTIRILPDGSMITIDHVIDELTTRFQGATALATVEVGGRPYIFVGGADDGITMFTLLPDGRLMHLQTLVDDDGMTLADVSAIAAAEVEGRITLFVSSATETGITQLSVDPGQTGLTRWVAPAGSFEGTAQNDLLRAGPETTSMRGGDGDDVLITYRDGIMLWGGAGRDVFVASAVKGRILIWDYDPDEDRLDLSQLGMIRSVWQISMKPFSKGIRLRFDETLIEIHSANRGTLTTDLFTNAMFPITHYTPPHVESLIVGSWRDDVLRATRGGSEVHGLQGNDVILGGLLDDVLYGHLGHDTITGGRGNDRLDGGFGNDRLRGGEDDDLLLGGGGDDMLLGDAGDDDLRGDGGNDSLFGGPGHDSLSGSHGHDYLSGGPGDDRLSGEAGNDSLSGDDGDDRLVDLSGNNILSGGAGDDTLISGAGADRLTGGPGRDLIRAGAGNDTLDGREDDDVLMGEAGDDRIFGGSGQDTISGGAGNDTIMGGDGADRITGDEGDDVIDGQEGDDHLSGGTGDDLIRAGAGNDSLFGDAGNDTLIGGGGENLLMGGEGDDLLQGDGMADLIEGGADNDTLLGHGGNDTLRGDAGDDMLMAGAGDDLLQGGEGHDLLMGGDGDDLLQGQGGHDHLDGGDGNDLIEGGAGADFLQGGAGADLFVFRTAADSSAAEMDHIADFEHGIDRIDLTALDLAFIGDQPFSAAGQLRLVFFDDHQRLQADLTGDGHADLVIRIDADLPATWDDLLL